MIRWIPLSYRLLYRAIPADGVCRLRSVLTDGRLLRLFLFLALVRVPFEEIELRPLVVDTDESTEQVPLVVGHVLDVGRLPVPVMPAVLR